MVNLIQICLSMVYWHLRCSLPTIYFHTGIAGIMGMILFLLSMFHLVMILDHELISEGILKCKTVFLLLNLKEQQKSGRSPFTVS